MAPTSTQEISGAEPVPALSTGTKLEPGIYVPTVAFFKEDEEVDIETTRKHVTMLAGSGIKGIGLVKFLLV